MDKLFKGIFKGLLYICTLPITLGILAIYSIVGIVMFFVVGIKGLVLFFSGRNIFGDLPEDIEAKRRINDLKVAHNRESEPVAPTVVEVVSPQANTTPSLEQNGDLYITAPEPDITPIENSTPEQVSFNEPSLIENNDIPQISEAIVEEKNLDLLDSDFEDDPVENIAQPIPEIKVEEEKIEESFEQPINPITPTPDKEEEIIGTYRPLGTNNDDEYDGGKR